jgi:hypothetical protein
MFMHHWSVGLARVYALQALEEEIRRSRQARDAEPPATPAGIFHATARWLAGFVHRLARRSSAEMRSLGCG